MKKFSVIFVACLLNFNAFGQDLAKLYKKVSSSVVVINTVNTQVSTVGNRLQTSEVGGLGSGVLISDDGLIWTASHVVHTADKVTVKFKDGDSYPAKILSSSPLADVALIQVIGDFQSKGKHIASIGDSDSSNIGDDLFIIGAPRGIEQTLSKGIISGRIKDDDLGDHFVTVEYIQTDASINPGNSGGPLFNMKGEVIGIASFILSEDGGFNGMGFGASSNVANQILMRENRFWSGMEFVVITPLLANIFNLPQQSGLLIEKAAIGGIVEKAGIHGGYIKAIIEGKEIMLGGDILLEVAGIKLDKPENFLVLPDVLKKFKPGDTYVIKYFRNGEVKFEIIKVE
jgi:serine protease Do